MSGFLNIGAVLLDHEIVDIIGSGGQCAVYKGRHVDTGDLVAIKVLSADSAKPGYDEHVRRLQREGSLRIGHPNIIDPIDCVEENGVWCLIMPFVEGTDLELFVRACGGRCNPDQTVSVLTSLADAFAAVHDRGVVHRDIKPANIIIKPDGTPVAVDFGIARIIHENTISSNGNLGTVAYMSPEQTQDGRWVDYRSDLFSLGLVFRFMLTGAHPVQVADTNAAKWIIQEQQFPPLCQIDPSIPPEMDAICSRLLAKRPEDRYQGARKLIEALTQLGGATHCCPSCHRPVPPQSRYCCSCGATVTKATAGQRCFACGASVGTDAACPQCRRPFGPTHHRLTFTQGTVAGLTFRIPEGIFEVGRAAISPRDISISRVHLRIACLNGTVFAQDAGSTNTTLVGGQPALTPAHLQPNQAFLIGGNLATYSN